MGAWAHTHLCRLQAQEGSLECGSVCACKLSKRVHQILSIMCEGGQIILLLCTKILGRYPTSFRAIPTSWPPPPTHSLVLGSHLLFSSLLAPLICYGSSGIFSSKPSHSPASGALHLLFFSSWLSLCKGHLHKSIVCCAGESCLSFQNFTYTPNSLVP